MSKVTGDNLCIPEVPEGFVKCISLGILQNELSRKWPVTFGHIVYVQLWKKNT